MHKLDNDTLITCSLLRRFRAEAEHEGGDGRFYAYIQKSNGDLVTDQNGPDIGPNEFMFANDMLTFLNKELHHDGAWCIVFTGFRTTRESILIPSVCVGEYTRFAFLWLDKDGDVQFANDCELGIVWATTQMSLHDWAGQCEAAWGLWHKAMRLVLEPKPSELYKRAQGQTAPTLH